MQGQTGKHANGVVQPIQGAAVQLTNFEEHFPRPAVVELPDRHVAFAITDFELVGGRLPRIR